MSLHGLSELLWDVSIVVCVYVNERGEGVVEGGISLAILPCLLHGLIAHIKVIHERRDLRFSSGLLFRIMWYFESGLN